MKQTRRRLSDGGGKGAFQLSDKKGTSRQRSLPSRSSVCRWSWTVVTISFLKDCEHIHCAPWTYGSIPMPRPKPIHARNRSCRETAEDTTPSLSIGRLKTRCSSIIFAAFANVVDA
jgi:hypothetical protein